MSSLSWNSKFRVHAKSMDEDSGPYITDKLDLRPKPPKYAQKVSSISSEHLDIVKRSMGLVNKAREFLT